MQDSLPRLQCCVWIRTTGPSVACSCWSRRSCWSRTMFLSESFRHHVEFSGVKASKLKSKQHMFKVYEHDSNACKYLRSNCLDAKRRHPIWSAPLICVICVEKNSTVRGANQPQVISLSWCLNLRLTCKNGSWRYVQINVLQQTCFSRFSVGNPIFWIYQNVACSVQVVEIVKFCEFQ